MLLVGLAANAENMHAAALRHRGFGKRGGKRAATGDDGERTIARAPASGLDWLTSALARRWDIVVRDAERAVGVRLDEVDDLPDERI